MKLVFSKTANKIEMLLTAVPIYKIISEVRNPIRRFLLFCSVVVLFVAKWTRLWHSLVSGWARAIQSLHAVETEGSQWAVVATLRGTSSPLISLEELWTCFVPQKERECASENVTWVDVCVLCCDALRGAEMQKRKTRIVSNFCFKG